MVRLGSNRLSYRLAGLADFTSSWLWSIQLRSAYCPLLLLFLSFPFSNQYLGGGLFQKSVSLHGGLSALDWHFLYDLITPLRSWIPSVPSELYPTTHSRHEHLISLPLWSLIEPLLEPETHTHTSLTLASILCFCSAPPSQNFLAVPLPPSGYRAFSSATLRLTSTLITLLAVQRHLRASISLGLVPTRLHHARTLRRNESFL
jgi:hypothetical protein